MHRYDLARYGSTLAVAALSVVLLTPAAMAGSNCSAHCSAKRSAVAAKAACASPAMTAAVPTAIAPARAAVSSAPAWMPTWVGPAPVSDVPDYSALFAPVVPHLAPGMIIAIDPETGVPMKPSEAQLRALTMNLESTDALAPSDAPMLMEALPGGGYAVTLNGHFQMYSIARLGADGRIVTDCAHDAATAKRMLVAPAPRVLRAEKE